MVEPALTERQQQILRAVVEEYVASATPVSSETLVREHQLGVSSATVRNELGELETIGYILQPHTSAGRVPSEQGYRYFVQHLMREEQLSPSEQLTIRHQFHQVALEREQWLQLSAAIISRAARAAAIVSEPQVMSCRLKHLEALQMKEQLGLLVLVLQDGTVKQQLVPLPEGITQEALSTASRRLNGLFRGSGRREIAASRETAEPLDDLERLIQSQVVGLMAQIDAQDALHVYHDGLLELLEQPEFARRDRARAIVQILERPQTLRELLPEAMAGGVQIFIGSENRLDWMKDCAIVLARYGPVGELTGVVGALGPLRFSYAVAVPAVRYVSGVMTELVSDLVSGRAVQERPLPPEGGE